MDETKSVPKLRFEGFDKEWNNYYLYDVIESFVNGQTPSRNVDSYWNGDIPWVSSGELNYNHITSTIEQITEEGKKNANLKLIPSGTFLMAITGLEASGTRGSCAILDIDATTNQSCMALFPKKEKLTTKFLYYWYLKVGEHYGIKYTQGTKQQSYNKELLEKLPIFLPNTIEEQNKITDFLSSLNRKIELLQEKHDYYQNFKKYLMQQIFAQKLRFKTDNNEDFDDWKERKLSEFLTEHKLKSTGKEEVYSVSVHKGLVNQVEHLGRTFSAPDTSRYNLVKPGDIVYTKSPTGDFPLGIIKQSRVDKNVIVSPLYGVFTPETYDLGYILNDYFESNVNTHNYLHPIVQKGAKNTMNITNKTFLSKSLFVPTDKDEQHKIAECLMKFNDNIRLIEIQKNQIEEFKHGLLQQMFV